MKLVEIAKKRKVLKQTRKASWVGEMLRMKSPPPAMVDIPKDGKSKRLQFRVGYDLARILELLGRGVFKYNTLSEICRACIYIGAHYFYAKQQNNDEVLVNCIVDDDIKDAAEQVVRIRERRAQIKEVENMVEELKLGLQQCEKGDPEVKFYKKNIKLLQDKIKRMNRELAKITGE